MTPESIIEKAETLLENSHKRYTYAVAGVCFLVSFLADFFSPLHTQYITATIASLCAIGAILLARGNKFSNLLNVPLFQYLIVGTLVCGGSAAVTTSYADDGGAMASNFSQVKGYQSMMGVIADLQEDVSQVRRDTTEIKESIAGLDKETSDDPQKELAKRGLPWHWFNFMMTATEGKLEETSLYRQAGMKSIGDCFALWKLFLEYQGTPENKGPIWGEVLAAIGDPTLNQECPRELFLEEPYLLQFPTLKPETRATLAESGRLYKEHYGNARTSKVSLLMLAVLANDAEMVELFLAHGAKPNVGMNVGNSQPVAVTPLAEARRLGFADIEKILVKHGAT